MEMSVIAERFGSTGIPFESTIIKLTPGSTGPTYTFPQFESGLLALLQVFTYSTLGMIGTISKLPFESVIGAPSESVITDRLLFALLESRSVSPMGPFGDTQIKLPSSVLSIRVSNTSLELAVTIKLCTIPLLRFKSVITLFHFPVIVSTEVVTEST